MTDISIEERLERLEAIEHIKALKYRYACALDEGYDPERVAALFCDEGIWAVSGVGGRAQGGDEIRAHCAQLSRSIIWSQHNIYAPLIELSADGLSAEGSFYLICLLTMFESGSDRSACILAGRYRDRFVCIDGRWYFKEIQGRIEQAAPWSEGWVRSPFIREDW